mgnify:CR=1 FL=1
MKPSGDILYCDDYGTIYHIEWTTTAGTIELTTITEMPYVWGEAQRGYVSDKKAYRYGVVTIHRQVIRPIANGYAILAEGISQYKDYILTTFNCGRAPKNDFKYTLNHILTEEDECLITDGVHWTDPDLAYDVVWPDVDPFGTDVTAPITGGSYNLEWTDVWAN